MKKFMIGIAIAAVILFSTGALIYARPNEQPNKENQISQENKLEEENQINEESQIKDEDQINEENQEYSDTGNEDSIKNDKDEDNEEINVKNDKETNENSEKNNKNTINISINGYNISILPPLGIKNQKTFKIGRTIPLKFILTDANGNIVENMSIKLFLAKVENGVPGSEIQAVSSGKSNDDNYFRFSKNSERYIFNLSTKGFSAGTWRLKIDLGNGTIFYTNITLG